MPSQYNFVVSDGGKTGLANELKLVRNQPLKWYMWPMAALTDPRFSEERVELTKPISFIYIIDDIFDVYGTLEELTLFTDAVNRYVGFITMTSSKLLPLQNIHQ